MLMMMMLLLLFQFRLFVCVLDFFVFCVGFYIYVFTVCYRYFYTKEVESIFCCCWRDGGFSHIFWSNTNETQFAVSYFT